MPTSAADPPTAHTGAGVGSATPAGRTKARPSSPATAVASNGEVRSLRNHRPRTCVQRHTSGFRTEIGSGASSYRVLDQQDGVLGLTDAEGSTETATYAYDAFVLPLTASGPQAATNPYRLASAYDETATERYPRDGRYFDEATGRRLQPGPPELPPAPPTGRAGGDPSSSVPGSPARPADRCHPARHRYRSRRS